MTAKSRDVPRRDDPRPPAAALAAALDPGTPRPIETAIEAQRRIQRIRNADSQARARTALARANKLG
jgi:hypothetical protein